MQSGRQYNLEYDIPLSKYYESCCRSQKSVPGSSETQTLFSDLTAMLPDQLELIDVNEKENNIHVRITTAAIPFIMQLPPPAYMSKPDIRLPEENIIPPYMRELAYMMEKDLISDDKRVLVPKTIAEYLKQELHKMQ